MNYIITSILLLLSIIVKAQFALENTYTSFTQRTKLEISGEKYYRLNIATNEAILYNSNHTLWKTIDLPLPAGSSVNSILHISETTLNTDASLEVIYNYSFTGTEYGSRIVNENGSILLTVENSDRIEVSILNGLSTKLIAYENDASSIYSTQDFVLEHTYTAPIMRVNLPTNGEKYCSYSGNLLSFYNNDHTYWKDVNLLLSSGHMVDEITDVSETTVNSDATIEITYTTSESTEYEGRVITENGVSLLLAPNTSYFIFEKQEGLSTKLLGADYSVTNLPRTVYSLPSLAVEHVYTEGYALRINLSGAGEKYYIHDHVNNQVVLYNSNHTIWKTISLSASEGYSLALIGDISENTINTDAEIEIAYVNRKDNLYECWVVKESGTTFLYASNESSIYVSKLEGLPSKLITYTEGGSMSTNVYSLPGITLAIINNSEFDTKIQVYPNPAKDLLTVELPDAFSAQMSLYTTEGNLLSTKQISATEKADFSTLKAGVYYLKFESQNESTVKKIIITE